MNPYAVLAVGAGASGLQAVLALLRDLPETFPVPVALACERDPDERDGLLRRLQQASRLEVIEPDDKDDLWPGRVYLAPAGYHLVLDGGTVALACDPEPAPPSPAWLFESVADSYGPASAAVLLCGDGAPPEGAEDALARVSAVGGLALRGDGSETIGRLLDELRRQAGGKDDRARRD